MSSSTTLMCTLLCTLILLSKSAKTEQTKLVIELFRHGARNPQEKIDILPIDDTREDYEDLTTTGMRNHYNLGKLLRKKFENYLPETLTPGVLAVKSSHPLRTVNSAISQINGMFTDGAQLQIETPDSPQFWTPPGFSITNDADDNTNNALPENVNINVLRPQNLNNNYLYVAEYLCPAAKSVYDATTAAWEADYVDSYQASYKVFEKNGYSSEAIFGTKDWTVKNALNLVDNLLASVYNVSAFKWNYELLLHATTLHAILQANWGTTQFVNKFANNALFQGWRDWIHRLEQVEKQAVDSEEPLAMPKMVLYSGHDVNLGQVIGALFKQDNFECLQTAYQKYVVNANVQNKADFEAVQAQIKSEGCFYNFQFASNLIIEIFVREDSNPSLDITDNNGLLEVSANKEYLMVRFFYNGEQVALDEELEMPIADFKQKLGKLILNNFNNQCNDEFLKNKNPQSQLKVIAIILILIVLVCLLATVGASCVREKGKSLAEGTGEQLINSNEHQQIIHQGSQ